LIDGVEGDAVNSYRFEIPELYIEDDIQIEMRPHQGMPQLYYKCAGDNSKEDSKDHHFNIEHMEEIIITKREH